MKYDYDNLKNDLSSFNHSSIGKSVMGREIFCIRLGEGKTRILAAGAFHGLEFLTSAFLMRFLNEFVSSSALYGYDIRYILNNITLWCVPMVNPDGVDIAVNGIDPTDSFHMKLIKNVGILPFTSVWQANANGVDLNHNYNALWSKIIPAPAPTKYGGENPESEPETKAMINLVKKTQFDMLLAFHSQGEEIYYDFNDIVPENSLRIAQKMASVSGYKVCKPEGSAAFGGFKDWFIQDFKKEGFTIEIGSGKNPLTDLNSLYESAAKLLLCALTEKISIIGLENNL